MSLGEPAAAAAGQENGVNGGAAAPPALSEAERQVQEVLSSEVSEEMPNVVLHSKDTTIYPALGGRI
jgi:hypothetical protein